jgi:hypothetical protein
MALTCYVICSQVYILTWQLFVFLTTVSVAAVSGFEPDNGKHRSEDSEEAARKYLENMENEFDKRANRASLARWAYASNITEENLKNQVRENVKILPLRVAVTLLCTCPCTQFKSRSADY